MEQEVRDIIKSYRGRAGATIPALQAVQEEVGYISSEAVSAMEGALGISQNEIYGVATFYSQFRFHKPGEHQVKVCLGTACHVRGGKALLDSVERELDVTPGNTTEDGNFSLERVACMGCCAVAPVMVVDDDIYGKLGQKDVAGILKKYGGGEQ